LLPHWRGAAPVQHAILAGDDVTGASTFRIEEGLDTGPIFGAVTTDIGSSETAGELLGRLADTGAGLMLATIDGIADGSLVPRPQPDDGASYAPKLEVDDARVDWSAPALRVDRLIRACTPAPGAWSTFRDRRMKFGPVRHRSQSSLEPGEVRADRDGVVVGTASTDVALTEVKPEGRGPMPAADWARGLRLQPGDRFS
jgi:methionyl-tRNA formyltransferase